jgi:hypothetical protein
MHSTLILDKIPATLKDKKVNYFLKNNEDTYLLNEWIGKSISIEFSGKRICLDCKKNVSKFYGQGLCYVCSMSSALNSPCIINPELCEAHLGNGRDVEWEILNHMQPHIVYLANSGGLKVGVTRNDQIPTRWIDQGADEAIILCNTPYRQLAGKIEVHLKNYLSDKTNWRTMLKNIKDINVDLSASKKEVFSFLPEELKSYISEDDTVYELEFPTTILEISVKSIKLDKAPVIEGILTGIKGQYLIFDEEHVFNVRTHSGYEVQIQFN